MKRPSLASRLPLRLSAVALIASASLPSITLACGYHLESIFLERVGLNVVYPDAMHVMGAISTAQIAKRLPMPVSAAATPDLFAYQRTVKALERLSQRLGPGGPPSSFSLVLVEQMLWTRFDLGNSVKIEVHVPAPASGELVVVSGEGVIAEIANARLSIAEARRLGLIRLYGSEAQIDRFLAASKRMIQSSATNG
jgi:hypothetical protein